MYLLVRLILPRLTWKFLVIILKHYHDIKYKLRGALILILVKYTQYNKSLKMRSSVDDQFSSFHNWQAIISNHTYLAKITDIQQSHSNPSKDAKLLSRRLSRIPAISAKCPSIDKSEPQYKVNQIKKWIHFFEFSNVIFSLKVPDNREVELIVKWKEVFTADTELQRMRELYKSKIQEFTKRWQAVGKGQRDLKQNLVKFNNFVR